jgi:HAE1 family hydrophobic/amphiphilic exporter-1
MGQQIELSQFATYLFSGPSKLERRDKTASVTVQGQKYRGFGWNYCNTMARKTRQARKTYGRKLHLGGDQENQSEGFGTLGIALLAAIILVT